MLFLCAVWLFVFFGQLFLSLNVGYEIWSCGKSISNKIPPAAFKGSGIFFFISCPPDNNGCYILSGSNTTVIWLFAHLIL